VFLARNDSVAGGSLFPASGDSFSSNAAMRIKYALDRLASVLLLLILFPFGLMIAVAIAVEAIATREPPKVFVSERRLSAGETFRLLKFRIVRIRSLRSHRQDPQKPSLKAIETAKHVTRTGRILKRFYLDELPQLVNIARGEMSLVGPRPYFVEDWKREPRLDIPARRLLKAGLVGPFQAVKGEISGLDAVNVIDSEYFEDCLASSPGKLLAKDLRLIVKSLGTLVRGEGL